MRPVINTRVPYEVATDTPGVRRAAPLGHDPQLGAAISFGPERGANDEARRGLSRGGPRRGAPHPPRVRRAAPLGHDPQLGAAISFGPERGANDESRRKLSRGSKH